MKKEKYKGFTLKFKKQGNLVYAYLQRAPKHIGSVDTYRHIGIGPTKQLAFQHAKDSIDLELEGLERAYEYAPDWRNRGW